MTVATPMFAAAKARIDTYNTMIGLVAGLNTGVLWRGSQPTSGGGLKSQPPPPPPPPTTAATKDRLSTNCVYKYHLYKVFRVITVMGY